MSSLAQPLGGVRVNGWRIAQRLARAGDLWGGVCTGLVALLAAIWTLKLWRADLTVPFRYSQPDDTKFYLMLIKGIIQHGWFLQNHNLGAPFGQQLFDYPQGADDLNLLLLRVIAVFTGQLGVVINVFLLLTFPLDAVAAYAVMRRLGVARPTSVICGVLFSLLPYHFFRSDSHLFLSAYYALPLVAYLFLQILSGQALFTRRQNAGRRARAWLTPRSAATAISCLIVASTGLYYAVFGLVLLAAGTVFAVIARHDRTVVRTALVACIVVVGTVAVNLAPTIVFQAAHGSNALVQHDASQGDNLALSPSYLVLPPARDRLAPLRQLTQRYTSVTPPQGYCEQCFESVGTVGDVGLLWLLVVGLGACVAAPIASRHRGTYRHAAAGVAVCIAVGTTGGLSSLTRVFVSSDIRAWNRLSVVIAFFALLSVGLALDAGRRRLHGRRGTFAFGVLLAAILLLGIVDQTSSTWAPSYRRDARQYRSDAQFVAGVAHTLPRGSEVFEMPYVPFPEGYQPFLASGQTIPYSHAINFEYEPTREYLQAGELRWSYGATKGRAGDWAAQLAAKPVHIGIAAAATAGFGGVVVDLRGYPGSLQAQVKSAMSGLLNRAPSVSLDRQLLFYDLRPYARGLRRSHSSVQLQALRDATLAPLRLGCATGLLTVVNPGRATRTASLTGRLSGQGQGVLRMTFSSGGASATAYGPQPRILRVSIRLPPGQTRIRLTVLGPGAQLFAPTILESAFAPFGLLASTSLRVGIVGPPCGLVRAG